MPPLIGPEAGVQAFMNVYAALREELTQDSLLGDQPPAARAWLTEVGCQQIVACALACRSILLFYYV